MDCQTDLDSHLYRLLREKRLMPVKEGSVRPENGGRLPRGTLMT